MTATTTITPVRKSNEWTYWLLGAFQVLDVATTWWILARLGGEEANPIVASVINGVGLPLSMILLLTLKLTICYALWRKGSTVKWVSVIYGAVIINNLIFLISVLIG